MKKERFIPQTRRAEFAPGYFPPIADQVALFVDVLPIQANRLRLADASPPEVFRKVGALILSRRTLPAVLAFLQLPTRLADLRDNPFKLLG